MAEHSSPAVAKERINKVREILSLLAKTASAYKIFPAEHATVRQFLQELNQRLGSYLDREGSLDLTIGENYFEFEAERVFVDEDTARSLPFFFFRDGMQRLSFHRGLNEAELAEFLSTIKQVAALPPEEADIVTAFWEKNFENISFYAPDEFIIDKIAAGRPLPEYEVNQEELFSGKIELSEDDKQAVENWKLRVENQSEPAETAEAVASSLVNQTTAELEQEEWQTLEGIVLGYRHLPAEEELARLLIEILYLEDRPEQLSFLKDSLHQAHEQLIQKGKWAPAATFLHDLASLHKIFAASSPEKAKFIDSFFHELEDSDRLNIIQKACFDNVSATNKEELINYLDKLGLPAITVLASLSENISPPIFDEIAFPILKGWASRQPSILMRWAGENKPHLTRLIIKILSPYADRQIITFLAGFISSGQPLLRKEAAEALGGIDLPAAKKILLAFLNDEKEEIRILAAQSLQLTDEVALEHFLSFVQPASLKKKSPQEALVFLQALARTSSPRVKNHFLHLCQQRWFLNPKMKQVALLAVEALKETVTPQSREILEAIAASGRPALRRTVRQILNAWPERKDQQGKNTL